MNKNKLLKALQLRDDNKNTEAINLLNEIIKSGPNEKLNVYLVLGEIYLSMNDFYKSLESFRKAFESKSDSELASLGMFHSLIELKDYDAAFSEMNRFLK